MRRARPTRPRARDRASASAAPPARARARPRRAAPVRRDGSTRSAFIAGSSSRRLAVSERADAHNAGDGAGSGRREVGLGALGAGKQALGVLDQHERGIGQPHAAAGGLEQRRAGLALEHPELLRDGRRAVGERVGDRADRAEALQLVQETEAAEVEHVRNHRMFMREIALLSMDGSPTMRPCVVRSSVWCRPRRSGRSGSSASSRRRRRERRRARCSCARARRRWCSPRALWRDRRPVARCGACPAGRPHRARPRRRGLQPPVGPVLRRDRPARRVDGRAAALHLPGVRDAWRRSRSAGWRRRCGPAPRWRWRRRARARAARGRNRASTSPARCWRSAPSLTYTTYILISDRHHRRRSTRSRSPLLVLTGATASFAVAGLATGSLDLALSGEAWLWLILIALVGTVVAVSAFFAGLRRVGRRRRRSFDSRAGRDSRWRSSCWGAAGAGAAGGVARWCWGPWCCCSCRPRRASARRRAGPAAGVENATCRHASRGKSARAGPPRPQSPLAPFRAAFSSRSTSP